MMADPKFRMQVLCHLLIILAAFIGCLFLDVRAAFLLLGTSLLLLLIQTLFQKRRMNTITRLCDEIDEILHGAEQFHFQQFQEGELSILSSEIHKMTIRLREQNHALKSEQLFMKESMEDISHQLRTPLTSMMLILGMMRKSDLSQRDRNAYLQELCELLTRMQWMIETLLNLSRLEAGAVTFQKSRISCRELIARAAEPLSIAIELKNIRLDVRIEGEPACMGDLPYCTEALENILKNCMEHTPEGGRITVTASENAIFTQILVQDTGAGIAQEDLPHIFERFYRSSDFAKKGYGIGLAFARKIITAQGGSLQVRNAEPHGAEFDLRMYRAEI